MKYMMPLINSSNALCTLYLFRLNHINLNSAFTNEDSETTLNTLISNNEDNYYSQELTAYRVGDEEFVLNINYNEIIKFNYAVLKIVQDSTYYYFFYITSYRAVSVERSAITLTLDTLTTFYKEMKEGGVKGTLNRATIPNLLTYEFSSSQDYPIINPDIMSAEDGPIDNYVVSDSDIKTTTSRYTLVKCKISYDFRSMLDGGDDNTPIAPDDIASNIDTRIGSCFPLNLGNYNASYYNSAVVYFYTSTEQPLVNPLQTTYGISVTSQGRYDAMWLVIPCNYDDLNNEYTYTGCAKVGNTYGTYTYFIFDETILPFNLWLKMNPQFAEYVEEVYLLPFIYNEIVDKVKSDGNESYLKHVYFNIMGNVNTELTSGATDTQGIYVVLDMNMFKKLSNDFNDKAIVTKSLNNFDMSTWLTTDTARSLAVEPKLYLYPYVYDELSYIDLVNIIIKYQDYPILEMINETNTSRTEYFFLNPNIVQTYLDFYDDTPISYGDFILNIYFNDYENINWTSFSVVVTDEPYYVSDYYYNYSYGESNFIKYSYSTSEYSEYRTYQKALVDSQLQYQSITSGVNMGINAIGVGAGIFGAMTSYGTDIEPQISWHEDNRRKAGGYLEVTGYEEVPYFDSSSAVSSGFSAVRQLGGLINNAVNLASAYKQRQLKESALSKRPPKILGGANGSGAVESKVNLDNGANASAIFYELSMPKQILEPIEEKFYLYGYSCPYTMATRNDEELFEYVFESRKYFNYVSFSDIEICSDELGIPYTNDMINRLSSGVTFYHINEYYTFDTALVNKQVKAYTEPIFTKGD